MLFFAVYEYANIVRICNFSVSMCSTMEVDCVLINGLNFKIYLSSHLLCLSLHLKFKNLLLKIYPLHFSGECCLFISFL